MRAGEIEETRIPRNPLDVLAQQIVAICADEEVSVDELHELARRAYPFAELSRAQLENVLDMLAGRYPSDEFAELRPRIVWDRTAGTVRGRSGARRLAVTNAGTIPDRGLFGVFLADGGGRVGELDEEMVYEAREGQTFLLGASTWRIEEITRDRVLVSPAPGVPGVAPFWKGEGVGRPAELGEKIGKTCARALGARRRRRDRAGRGRVRARRARRAQPRHVPARAGGGDRCRSLRPDDRRRALPRRDRRLARLHPLAVRRPRARAVGDGAAGAAARRARPRRAVDLVGRRHRAALPGRRRAAAARRSAARAGRDRGSPARRARAVGAVRRALPGERGARPAHPATPARPAHAALAAAPEGAEPAPGRAALPAVPDRARDLPRGACRTSSTCPRCAGSCGASRRARSRSSRSRRSRRRPFASSLLFEYVATYMYEDDTPPEERRAQALSLDRDLLRELMGIEELRELLDLGAIEQVEASLRPAPRNVDELHDLLRRAGPLLDGEYDRGFAETLLRERRAIRVRLGRRRAARRRRGRRARARRVRRRAAGRRAAASSSSRSSARCARCSGGTRRRTARSRRPRSSSRFGLDAGARRGGARGARASTTSSSAASSARAARSASGAIPTSCAASGARRSPCSGARSSRRSRSTSGASCPRGTGSAAGRACARRSSRCRASPLPATLWESDVLPRRVPGVPAGRSRRALRLGRGRLGRRGARPRRRLLPRRRGRCSARRRPRRRRRASVAVAVRAALAERALFWADLVGATGLAGRGRARPRSGSSSGRAR